MHKFIRPLTLCLALFTVNAAAATSVWKVSKGDDYIYLAGTVHLLPAREYPLPSAFADAYRQTDSLILEAPLPETMAEQQQMLATLQYPAGQSLSKQLKPAVRAELEQYVQTLGMPFAMVDGYKPGFVAMQLTLLEMSKAGLSGDGVDKYFLTQAKSARKPLQYLETLEFQIELIGKLGADDPDAFIKMSLAEAKDSSVMLKKLIKAWRAGDMGFIEREVLQKAKQDDLSTYRLMFTDRNQRWLPQLQQMFQQPGHELVMVGAAHLPGEDGVLQLLQQAGFSLQQMP
jgi:uncharacterized protein YbaP (TraB family)